MGNFNPNSGSFFFFFFFFFLHKDSLGWAARIGSWVLHKERSRPEQINSKEPIVRNRCYMLTLEQSKLRSRQEGGRRKRGVGEGGGGVAPNHPVQTLLRKVTRR